MSAERLIATSGGATTTESLRAHLAGLKLSYVLEHFESLIITLNRAYKHWLEIVQ